LLFAFSGFAMVPKSSTIRLSVHGVWQDAGYSRKTSVNDKYADKGTTRFSLSLSEFGANDLEEMVIFARATVMRSRNK
jgi:hypothetical protein